MHKTRKPDNWGVLKSLFAGIAAYLTVKETVETTLELTEGASSGKRFWLYPIVLLLWVLFMLPLALVLLLLGLAGCIFLGYIMDVPLLLGIDKLLSDGNTAEAVAMVAVGAFMLLAYGGYIFELIRRQMPDSPRVVPLVASVISWALLVSAGFVPYVMSARDKIPVFHL